AGQLDSTFEGRLEKFATKFNDITSKYEGGAIPSNWHKIDNALQVPFIPADNRLTLLSRLRDASQKLDAGSGNAGSGTTNDKRSGTTSGHEAAQRQGKMALAMLGETWVFDATKSASAAGSAKSSFAELQQLLRQPSSAPEWWKAIQYDAGEQIGWHWREMVRETER